MDDCERNGEQMTNVKSTVSSEEEILNKIKEIEEEIDNKKDELTKVQNELANFRMNLRGEHESLKKNGFTQNDFHWYEDKVNFIRGDYTAGFLYNVKEWTFENFYLETRGKSLKEAIMKFQEESEDEYKKQKELINSLLSDLK